MAVILIKIRKDSIKLDGSLIKTGWAWLPQKMSTVAG